MTKKNEIMDILDCEVVEAGSNDIQISGTEIVTNLVAVIPNAIAAPIQRYHEVEAKKEVALRTLEYREKELEHCTKDRDKLCDTMIELAKNKALDKEMFQMFMVAYANH